MRNRGSAARHAWTSHSLLCRACRCRQQPMFQPFRGDQIPGAWPDVLIAHTALPNGETAELYRRQRAGTDQGVHPASAEHRDTCPHGRLQRHCRGRVRIRGHGLRRHRWDPRPVCVSVERHLRRDGVRERHRVRQRLLHRRLLHRCLRALYAVVWIGSRATYAGLRMSNSE